MNFFNLLAASLLFVGCSGSATMRMNDAEAGAVPKQDSAPRKIIYTASLDLVVDDLPKAEEEVNRLVQAQGGYIAKSELRGSPGMPRSGTWTVRIPVDSFKAFLDAAGKLGELTRSKTDSDDITDKYHDLQAHLKNNQVEEEGLRKVLLEKSASGKLEDVLAVRREIRAIRGEIDMQQGQILRWDKETAFTTITLNISDRKGYVPPTAPSLRTSVGRTFEDSVDALANFGRGLLLAIVAILPWLPLIIAGLLLVRYGWRRRRTRITTDRS